MMDVCVRSDPWKIFESRKGTFGAGFLCVLLFSIWKAWSRHRGIWGGLGKLPRARVWIRETVHPPPAHTHVSVGSLERWIGSKLPAHLHCRQCLLIGRQLGQASAPGLRGTREEIWSEGKARKKGEKQPKKRLMGNSTLSPDLNHSLSLLTFSMLCFWMILLLRLNFNLGNFSQLNLPDERMVLPAHDMILARRCFQWFNGSLLTIES